MSTKTKIVTDLLGVVEKSGGQEQKLMKQGPELCFQQSSAQAMALQAGCSFPPLPPSGLQFPWSLCSQAPQPLSSEYPLLVVGPPAPCRPALDPAPSASEQHGGEWQANSIIRQTQGQILAQLLTSCVTWQSNS